MADGFVAGQAEAAKDVFGGTNESFLCGGLQAVSQKDFEVTFQFSGDGGVAKKVWFRVLVGGRGAVFLFYAVDCYRPTVGFNAQVCYINRFTVYKYAASLHLGIGRFANPETFVLPSQRNGLNWFVRLCPRLFIRLAFDLGRWIRGNVSLRCHDSTRSSRNYTQFENRGRARKVSRLRPGTRRASSPSVRPSTMTRSRPSSSHPLNSAEAGPRPVLRFFDPSARITPTRTRGHLTSAGSSPAKLSTGRVLRWTGCTDRAVSRLIAERVILSRSQKCS